MEMVDGIELGSRDGVVGEIVMVYRVLIVCS